MNRFKKELELAKREIKQLRKALGRYMDNEAAGGYEEDEEPAPRPKKREPIKTKADNAWNCNNPKKDCPGTMRVKEFGQFKYKWCDDCGHRIKLK